MKVATKSMRPSVGSVNRDSGRDKGRGPSGPPSPPTPGTPVSTLLFSTRPLLEKARAVRAAQAGAGVPAGPGRVGAVVSAGDVAEAGHVGTRRHARVQGRLDQAEPLAGRLREPADQRRPQRSDRAGA